MQRGADAILRTSSGINLTVPIFVSPGEVGVLTCRQSKTAKLVRQETNSVQGPYSRPSYDMIYCRLRIGRIARIILIREYGPRSLTN